MRTYTIRELTKVTGFDARTIRRYVQRGLLEPPLARGPQTRYPHPFLVRLLAIRTLKETHYSTEKVRSILASSSEQQIAALAGEPPPPTAPAAELTPAPSPSLVTSTERWKRIVLVSGLELFVRERAGALVERLAGEIEQRYAVPE
jgi:DNA-binding transcriptional MerR regulator